MISGNHCNSLRIPGGSSVFTAEAKAIDLALDFINSCFLTDKFLIFSDSLSVLKALNHTSSRNSQIQKLLEKHHEITKRKEILFCWLSIHVDITGNETADRKAKESLKLNMSTFEVPFNNFKPFINTYILSEGQKSWETAAFNKLHAIKPVIRSNSSAIRNIRREDVVITRLRIGHTRFTHSYLLNREEQPFCIVCYQYITVKHILTDCIRGWSGGAMALGKLPVPGRPTILITVGQGPIALAVGTGGVVWTFLLSSILSLLSPSLGRWPDID